MQQMEQKSQGWGGAERQRVEAVVETLATLRGQGESLAEVAHDVRNMVTALGLYCDLLEEPGVLAAPFRHYGNELRLVATASRRLVEKLVALDSREAPGIASTRGVDRGLAGLCADTTAVGQPARTRHWDLMPAEPIDNLADELLASKNLLSALAGPSIAVTVDAERGAKPVRLTGEDLTRLLVNLVKNAAEALPAGGRIKVNLCERLAARGAAQWLALTIEDNGPGILPQALDRIFESGYTTWAATVATHRGLGLSITRSIVEAAGGRIHAVNCAEAGARFEIELPVRIR